MSPLLLAPLLLLPAAPPEADRNLVNRLETVRLSRAPDLAADPKAAAAYADAFRDAGLDVLTAPSAETAAALAKHARRDDLIAAGSMAAAKAAGKVRMEGKDYVMADGDVVEFRFGQTAKTKQ